MASDISDDELFAIAINMERSALQALRNRQVKAIQELPFPEEEKDEMINFLSSE